MSVSSAGPASGQVSFSPSRNGERGIALIVSLLVMLMISALGTSMLVVATADIGASVNYRGAKEAFYEADSGIQRSMMDLVANSNWAESTINGALLPIFIKDPFPDDVTINGYGITLGGGAGGPQPGWYPFGATESLGNGTFSREIYLPPPDSEQANAKGSKLWVVLPVRSTGAIGATEPSTQVVQSDIRVLVFRLSIWDNAIFAGEGQAGKSIKGNVEVRGSVHVVGDPNNPTLLDWGGGATVRNSYVDAAINSNWDVVDAAKLPSLPAVDFNGVMVQSLDAEVRVKNGDLDYGGNSSLGDPDAFGNGVKDTLDGFYADGTVTLSGSASIHADTEDDYDIKENIPFPTLDDPYDDPATGTPWAHHRDYLNAKALTMPVNEISSNTGAFSISDASGNSVAWDPATNLMNIQARTAPHSESNTVAPGRSMPLAISIWSGT